VVTNVLDGFSEKGKPETGFERREAGFAVLSCIWNISVCKDLQRECRSTHCTLILILD